MDIGLSTNLSPLDFHITEKILDHRAFSLTSLTNSIKYAMAKGSRKKTLQGYVLGENNHVLTLAKNLGLRTL